MTEQSDIWDKQWSTLLTHCHGKPVEADPAFKADLLERLKSAASANAIEASKSDSIQDSDSQWRRLLKATYIPCHPDTGFKSALLTQLKTVQADRFETASEAEAGEHAIRTILSKSYQPVEPRRDFQARLLVNLKERQRSAAAIRRTSRRRTLFMSAASGIAAAAMVMFTLWVGPVDSGSTSPAAPAPIVASNGSGVRLPVRDVAKWASPTTPFTSTIIPVGFGGESSTVSRPTATPAVYETAATKYGSYRIDNAFASPPLPEKAIALNVSLNRERLDDNASFSIEPGQSFQSTGGMGHMNFSDGTLLTLSPDSVIAATDNGITVRQGFVLVAVPENNQTPFRLHFPERDIAVAPGTDLALMVEDPEKYAEGGAPAPMIMVLDSPNSPTGLAFARGKNGVGPLFSNQLYRLDNYVTPELPGRTMCDVEREDLNNLFKKETVYENRPYASFAGGFTSDRDLSFARTILVPAGFSKKGDTWVADTYRDQPTVKLEYLSDSYFGFINERRDLSHILSLGGRVILDGGDGVFYEIRKTQQSGK